MLVVDAKRLLKQHQINIPPGGGRSWAARLEAASENLPSGVVHELRELVTHIEQLDRRVGQIDREIKHIKAFERAVERMKEPCLEFMVTTGQGSPIDREKLLAGRIERILLCSPV